MKYLATPLFVFGFLLSVANPPNRVNPDDAVTMHGKIFDSMSHLPVSVSVKVVFFHNSDFIEADSCQSVKGEFTANLTRFGWYQVSLMATGYLELRDTLWVLPTRTTPIERVYYMSPRNLLPNVITSNDNLFIKSQERDLLALRTGTGTNNNQATLNVYFPFGKSTLTETTRADLLTVAGIVKGNNTVLDIKGYTDNNGPEDYNLMLAEWRAQAVVNYLVALGVNSLQLTIRSYGESRPTNRNATPDERAKNRRVELVLRNGQVDQARINAQLSTN
jgi:outer membrane protein OmpA-like peptidoglycan-associated protein